MRQKLLRFIYRCSSDLNVWAWHQLNRFNRYRKYHPNKKYMRRKPDNEEV